MRDIHVMQLCQNLPEVPPQAGDFAVSSRLGRRSPAQSRAAVVAPRGVREAMRIIAETRSRGRKTMKHVAS
jgi:hypothetical protein